MKYISIILIQLSMFSSIAFAQQSDTEKKASEFSTLLFSKKYAEAHKMFSASLQGKISAEKLQETWDGIENKLGSVARTDEVWSEKSGATTLTYQPLHFEKMMLDMKIVFNAEAKIEGFTIVPHKEKELALTQTDLFSEKEVTVKSGKFQLKGILTIPKVDGKVPAVVLVHGSGPNDMDVSIGPNKIFKQLAHGLAEKGIAVLRYDKRTKTYGGDPALDAINLTLYDETIEDALSAVELLGKQKGIDKKKIFLAGHSLGAMTAPRIASLNNNIAGIILLAGNARPLQELLPEQYKHIFSEDGEISTEEQSQIDELKAQLINLKKLEKGEAKPDELLPLGIPETYWKYLLEYNQVATAKKLNIPMLIVQGGRDYQVPPKEFELWKAALADKKNVTFKLYPKLNHLLFAGEGICYPAEYENEAQVDTTLIADLAEWMKMN